MFVTVIPLKYALLESRWSCGHFSGRVKEPKWDVFAAAFTAFNAPIPPVRYERNVKLVSEWITDRAVPEWRDIDPGPWTSWRTPCRARWTLVDFPHPPSNLQRDAGMHVLQTSVKMLKSYYALRSVLWEEQHLVYKYWVMTWLCLQRGADCRLPPVS